MTMMKFELLICMIDRFSILWKDQNIISYVDFRKSKNNILKFNCFSFLEWNLYAQLFLSSENCCFEVQSPNLGKSTSDFQKSTSDFQNFTKNVLLQKSELLTPSELRERAFWDLRYKILTKLQESCSPYISRWPAGQGGPKGYCV